MDLDVIDIDGLGVTVTMVDVVEGITISPTGHVTWDAEAKKTEKVTILLSDPCGATSERDINFVVHATYWSNWSDWGECSTPCDYGLHTRHRSCLSSAGCPEGTATSQDMCRENICPGSNYLNKLICFICTNA